VALYRRKHDQRPWQPITGAPSGEDVEVLVADNFGSYALAFPCRLTRDGWVNANTDSPLEVRPTHWRQRKAAR
jgi:hypothetical protein